MEQYKIHRETTVKYYISTYAGEIVEFDKLKSARILAKQYREDYGLGSIRKVRKETITIEEHVYMR